MMKRLRLKLALVLGATILTALYVVAWLGPGSRGPEDAGPAIGWLPLVAASLLGSTILAWLLSRWLSRPLADVAAALETMAEGGRPPSLAWRGRDALGRTARAIHDLARRNESSLADALAEKERVQAVLHGMVEGVLVLDAAGRITLANQRVRELFGVWGEVLGRPPLEVIRRDEVDEALRAAQGSSEPVTSELSLGQEGERKVQMHAVRFPTSGPPLGVVAVFHDLTEVRRLERMRREFVANVSHELKTPLTAIRGFAETLQHQGLTDEQRGQFTEVILRHANRLTELIEDLLELSRIEGRRQPLRLVEVRLGEVTRALIRDLEPRFDAKSLGVDVEVQGDCVALADRRAVEQVVLNLVDNAIKYSEPGGRIEIRMREQPSRLQVTVRDDGIGIPHEDQARIFERFYRVDKARSRDLGGTGLGLAIVKHLVQSMDGDVTVESDEGEGCCFSFSLPRADADNVTSS